MHACSVELPPARWPAEGGGLTVCVPLRSHCTAAATLQLAGARQLAASGLELHTLLGGGAVGCGVLAALLAAALAHVPELTQLCVTERQAAAFGEAAAAAAAAARRECRSRCAACARLMS